MTKTEFVHAVQTAHPDTQLGVKRINALLDTAFHLIGTTVKKEGRFRYPSFGTFNVSKRKARTGRNPRTGDPIKIKASKTMTFKASKELRKTL